MIAAYTDIGDLDLCETYCTCGTPDPYNCGHTESCPMSFPVDILREVEAICVGTMVDEMALVAALREI